MFYLLGIGTNIGNKKENLDFAIKSLNLVPNTSVFSTSAIYETEPIGYDNQDSFYNMVALVKSDLEPSEILGVCLGIEAGFGRIREFKNGPRILDIDVLMAENIELKTKNLTVPHERMFERRFVLQPMLDIFTDGNAFGIDFKAALKNTENQKVKRI